MKQINGLYVLNDGRLTDYRFEEDMKWSLSDHGWVVNILKAWLDADGTYCIIGEREGHKCLFRFDEESGEITGIDDEHKSHIYDYIVRQFMYVYTHNRVIEQEPGEKAAESAQQA